MGERRGMYKRFVLIYVQVQNQYSHIMLTLKLVELQLVGGMTGKTLMANICNFKFIIYGVRSKCGVYLFFSDLEKKSKLTCPGSKNVDKEY